jgi:hypothetical protein
VSATANRELAERARVLADRAPAGSLERKALACAAVALRTTGTLRAARAVLAEVDPAEVRAAALDQLDQLAGLLLDGIDTPRPP